MQFEETEDTLIDEASVPVLYNTVDRTTIYSLAVPPVVLLSTEQPAGPPAEPKINVDDYVLKGQLIAKALNESGINIHASTSGQVIAIALRTTHVDELKRGVCIVIESDGKDQWLATQPCAEFRTTPPDILLTKIFEAGITHSHGFSTTTAIGRYLKKRPKAIVVSACYGSDELQVSDVLLLKYAPEILLGLTILRRIFQHDVPVIFALDQGKEQVAASVSAAIRDEQAPYCEVRLLHSGFVNPSHSQLIEMITGVSILDNHSPETDYLCLNVATLYDIYQAICLGKPVTNQFLSVNGSGFSQPALVSAPLGTPINFVMQQQGYDSDSVCDVWVNAAETGHLLVREAVPLSSTIHSLWSVGQENMFVDSDELPILGEGDGLRTGDYEFNFDQALAESVDMDADDDLKPDELSHEDELNIEDDLQVDQTSDPGALMGQLTSDSVTSDSVNTELTGRSRTIAYLQNQLKDTEKQLDNIDSADDESIEALLLSINILLERIRSAQAARELENNADSDAQAQSNNQTLTAHLSSLQQRMSLAQERLANSERVGTAIQSAIKHTLNQLDEKLEQALGDVHHD